MKLSHAVASICVLASVAGIRADPTAASVGPSITISDGNYSGTGWYGNHEDNETETNPNTVQGQDWDLEGMYMNSQALTLVGGFDFRNGNTYGNYTYKGGDIFIDTDGDAKYTQADNGSSGTGGTVSNSFGYDYVVHFNSSVTSYSVYKIDASTTVARALDIQASNPWKYVSGGTALAGYQNVAVGGYGLLNYSAYSQMTTYGSTGLGLQGAKNSKTGYWDNNHYYLTVDTSFLPSKTVSTFHYTMECGNDNLMGRTTTASVPDTGSTALLLAGALLSLVGIRNRKRFA